MGGLVAIVSPAPFFDARRLFARIAGAKPFGSQLATYQLVADGGVTFGLSIEDKLLVVIGFWQTGVRAEEMFMLVADPDCVRPHAVALQRAGRLIVRRRLHDADVDRIVSWTSSSEGAAGRRLARAAGLVLCPCAQPGAFSLWEIQR